MTPTPQCEAIQGEAVPPRDGNQVVISGMSGLFPSSSHVKDLENILYNKINPIKKDDLRWKFQHPEVAQYSGNIPELDRFDSQFFMVHHRLALSMDVMARKVLEQAYTAIYDAGVCPDSLSGKKIGVYIGSALSESEKAMFFCHKNRLGFAITGSSKTMFANRISYWLNSKGPSISIDDVDCSSSAALEQAYCAILRGDCEAAIVGGTNLCLHPQSSVLYAKQICLSSDGKTNSYSADASGFVISEAVSVLFLQRAKDAVRIYAEVVHVNCKYSKIEEGEIGPLWGFYRDPKLMAEYLKNFYDSIGIPPSVVEYVEGFGSADPKADKSELEAFDKVFCNNREEPLLVGSVISNIGHVEAASGMTATIKVLLGYHHGKLAGNLNCENPRNDVAAIKEGRIQVLDDHREFRRSYVAINNLSMTGVNAHILLNGHNKPKNLNLYKTNIPRLVTISGRKDTSVKRAFEELVSHPIDAEELALLQNIHGTRITGHLGRGFILLDTVEEQTVSLLEKVDTFDDAQRPLWFVYSGMGSQWSGMGKELMRIPIFAAAIERCHQVLAPKGLNIVQIISSPDKTMFDNILHSFVGIAAVQIGLTDVLRELGLVPDNIIGHSMGEMGCAYADGCVTTEEMILSTYSRGLVSLETPFIKGSMAAVGLGFHQVTKICPPEIEIACHNSADSCTISGPAEPMKNFVSELVAKGIFAKEVPCSNIAYHSRYIASAGPGLLKYLNEVIKTPRERSKRWVSTSVCQDKWDTSIAKFSSAEYHTNNMLSPVLFEETSKLIPSNAVVVEVAPHGLLQAILKRSLPQTCTNIPLTRRGHNDAVLKLLEAVGQLYMSGYHPKIQVLYPKVEFPVSTGTPLLSHYVDWAHHEKWPLPLFEKAHKITAASCKFVLSVHDDEYKFLKGHVIGNKTVIPFSFALVAVWDTLAMSMQIPKKKLGVKFSDVHFYAQPKLLKQNVGKIDVSLNRGNGYFEVMNKESRVITGYINEAHSGSNSSLKVDNFKYKNEDIHIDGRDMYQILFERGYNYSGQFRSIHSLTETLDEAQIIWNDNWVTLLDGMLQLNALKQPHNSISLVTHIRKIHIDYQEHAKYVTKNEDGKILLKAHVNGINDITRCGGILMNNVKFRELQINNDKEIILKTLKLQEDAVLVSEYLPLEEIKENACDVMLRSGMIGDLNSLNWVQTPLTTANGIHVKVQFAGIHMNDFKKAAGVNDTSTETDGYGLEFSGLTESGERVMGLVENGALRSALTVHPEFVWPVPSHWSMEDAATVPLAYAMAYYCLEIKSSVRMGMSMSTVLIHGGAGALGQAAIAIALAKGYRVFTTVSDVHKKKFLLRLFPNLNVDYIGNSRDSSFADMVLSATGGIGCDIVICSLEGELKNVSLKCCAPYGLTYDTTQLHNKDKFSFGMSFLTFCRNYIPLDITSIFSNPKSKEVAKIKALITDGIVQGHVRPLTRVTFAASDAPRAFRMLSGRHNRGRVLLKIQDEQLPALSRLFCSGEGCHIIFCDKHSLGFQLTDMLIASGVKKLYLHTPNPTAFLRYKQRMWNKIGIQVSISSEYLQDLNTLSNLITNVSSSNFINGIHVASNDLLGPELITHLDLTTRKLCPNLKYFSVFTNGREALSFSLERTKNKLPVTVVNLAMLDNVKDEEGLIWYQGIKKAAEQALQSSYPFILAQLKNPPKISLVQQIAALADTSIPEEVNDETLLQDLGLEEEKTQILSCFLRDAHNISIDEKQLLELSIGSIKEIERNLTETEFEDVQGLGAIFTYVDPDELTATSEVVAMSTLTYSLAWKNDEINVDDSFLFIMPGLEGHHLRFTALCERLKLSANVLQPGIDHPHETVPELAARFSKIVRKLNSEKKHFHLLGYETGVFSALELAAILEQQGYIGTVYCIGDGPAETKAWIQDKISQFNFEEGLECGILLHILKLMAEETIDNECLMKELNGEGSWERRVDACVKTLLGHSSHSAQYARGLIQSAYTRIVTALNYTPNFKPLQSQIVLLRSSISSPSSPTTLQLYSEKPIFIHDLETPLVHAAQDMRCAALINRYLSKAILEAFEKKVLCDTYLLNLNIITSE